ncbi:hypothetical protein [Kribbella italica]|uniref:Uncharacterized protein n=1 Tax=Kribbella italica TaxID=1540520 RepID=A0A7W9J5J4_9ACTN|nr:hypothetical protein [Kribbella italica]MBB5835984.1 hypothetical protein [Kribbella italica]
MKTGTGTERRSSNESSPEENRQIQVDDRISHPEYGNGTVVLFNHTRLQVVWDIPFSADSPNRMLDHSPSFVDHLTLLPAE